VQTGDAMTISVDTRVPSGTPAVILTFLSSYNEVGVLHVSCFEAYCSCTPGEIDTLRPKEQNAQLSTYTVEVDTSTADCRLDLRNSSPKHRPGCSAPASSPCTKVKVVGWSVVARRRNDYSHALARAQNATI
jgi:hypothetical protein